MSPERLVSGSYTFILVFLFIIRYRCDYWSMAMVIMEAALGFYPIRSTVTHVEVGDDNGADG